MNINDTETALAGCLLLNHEKVFCRISGLISADDFQNKAAAAVFSMSAKRFSSSQPFDLLIAAQDGPLESATLTAMTDIIPGASFAIEYAKQISAAGRKRRVEHGLAKLKKSDMKVDEMLSVMADIHGREIRAGSKSYRVSDVAKRFSEEQAENARAGDIPGIRTGFDFMDREFIRYAPGHIWMITGFTSSGKTKMLIEKVFRTPAARTMVISTEMTENQMMARMYARCMDLPEYFIQKGDIRNHQQEQYNRCVNDVSKRPLKIVDDIYECSDIEALIMQESMQGDLDLAFIDYVQNCNIKGIPEKQQGAVMAKRLQQLAKKSKCCIICMSQVSNSVGRGDVDQFEAKGAGEWAAVADVGVRLRRSSNDDLLLGYDMQKARHYKRVKRDLYFSRNFTRIKDD
jgi:replicative DNA helicase